MSIRKLLLLSLLIFSIIEGKTQDIITGKTGGVIKAKILEVSIDKVVFRKFDDLQGPNYSVNIRDIVSIEYANGKKDSFVTPETNTSTALNIVPFNADMYARGKADATKYYHTPTGMAVGTLAISLFNPLIGVIPAALIASSEPSEANLKYPNVDLMRNQDYQKGYKTEAKSIKKRKVWTCYGVGVGVNIAIYAAIIGSLMSAGF